MSKIANFISIRHYHSTDLSACLNIFRSNMPKYFAESEFDEYASFLASFDGEYLVAEVNNQISACGGSYVKDGIGRLCWGMVNQSKHRSSLGSALLTCRINNLFSQSKDLLLIQIDTSQHSAGFFERFGFKTTQVIKDGFDTGLDCVVMSLKQEDWLLGA